MRANPLVTFFRAVFGNKLTHIPPEHEGTSNWGPEWGDVVMQNQSRVLDGQRLLMTYSPSSRNRNGELGHAPSNFAEAAIRILGACLLLYQQQVPTREYYEVHPTY